MKLAVEEIAVAEKDGAEKDSAGGRTCVSVTGPAADKAAANEAAYDTLKLESQLCFPLYACAREVTRACRPFLDELCLTYTQYIAMMVMWEHRTVTVKRMGQLLHLDSGTLTPLLKKLEERGLVRRSRLPEDERSVAVTVTEAGMALRDRAIEVPRKMSGCVNLSAEDARELYRILYQLLDSFER